MARTAKGLGCATFPSGLTSPFGMTVLDLRLLVADSGGDELWEINPDGGDAEGTNIRDFPATLTTPLSMAALSTSLGPTDHAVNAGSVSWAFELPQPTVTHTPAVELAFNRESSLDISLGAGDWFRRRVRRHHALVR